MRSRTLGVELGFVLSAIANILPYLAVKVVKRDAFTNIALGEIKESIKLARHQFLLIAQRKELVVV